MAERRQTLSTEVAIVGHLADGAPFLERLWWSERLTPALCRVLFKEQRLDEAEEAACRVNTWESKKMLSRVCVEIEASYDLTVVEGREGRGMPGCPEPNWSGPHGSGRQNHRGSLLLASCGKHRSAQKGAAGHEWQGP